MKKNVIRLMALCLAALMLTACGSKQEAASDRLTQVQEKGELVIALEGN